MDHIGPEILDLKVIITQNSRPPTYADQSCNQKHPETASRSFDVYNQVLVKFIPLLANLSGEVKFHAH